MPHLTQNEEPLDDFVARLLAQGTYRVDLETGQIVSGYSGRPLSPSKKLGYRVVSFAEGGVSRKVRCHRVIAIALWGVDAVRGKDVGHDDGHRAHNDPANLWLPETRKQHMDRDGVTALMIERGFKPVSNYPPCAGCGDPEGVIRGKNKTPIRCSGKRFGIDGKLCYRCYTNLRRKQKRQEARDDR